MSTQQLAESNKKSKKLRLLLDILFVFFAAAFSAVGAD